MKRSFALALLFTALPASSWAQGLTLADFLSTLAQSHPFFAQQALNPSAQQQAQLSLAANEDWVLSGGPRFQHQQRAEPSAFVAQEQDQFAFNAGIERQFWDSGSYLSFDYDYYALEQEYGQPVGSFEEQGNALSVTYSLPMLKNRGGVLSRLAYELQGYQVELAEVQSLENQEGFLQQQANLFIDWTLLNEQLRIAENRLVLAEEEQQRTQKKRRSRLVSEVDVLRAESAVITAQQAMQKVKAFAVSLQARLATEAGQDTYLQAQPRFDLYAQQLVPALADDLDAVLNQSRLLQAIDIQIEQIQHQQTGLDQTMDPELDLFLSGGLASEDTGFADSARFDQPQYSIGLTYRQALGQRGAKADVSKARIQRQQLVYQRASLALQLKAELRQVLVQLHELNAVMGFNRQQIEVARQKTLAEIKRHNQGRSELTFVIQSRDAEQNAQLLYAENAATYQKLWLAYLGLSDQLLASIKTE